MGTSKPFKEKQKAGESSNLGKGSSKRNHGRRNSRHEAGNDALPGVQKIKAALRQTRRLLQKENLAADIRVATERRLKSLEADLAKAELARVERAMAIRYHKVKFFERQKIVRKISQIKKQLEHGIDEEGEPLKRKQRKELEKKLFEKRIDLNYILHYPKTSKYISLFPTKSRQDEHASNDEDNRPAPEAQDTSDSSKKREEWRHAVRKAMETGTMGNEPEMELLDRSRSPKARGTTELHHGAREGRIKTTPNPKVDAKTENKALLDDNFFEMDE